MIELEGTTKSISVLAGLPFLEADGLLHSYLVSHPAYPLRSVVPGQALGMAARTGVNLPILQH